MDTDLSILCTCPDYQHEIRIEAGLCVFAYSHGIALPQIPWKFCPYCGREFQYPIPSNNGVQLTRRAGEIVNEESGGEQLTPDR